MINNVEKIKCTRCNYWLPLDQFWRDNASKVGRKSYCKACGSKYNLKRKKYTNYNGVIGIFLHQCTQCGVDFTSKKGNAEFCSRPCYRRWTYEKYEQSENAKKYGTTRNHLNFNNGKRQK